MGVYDINVGVPCDHRFRQFVDLVPTANPNEYTAQLKVTLPTINENCVLYQNEVKVSGVSFTRVASPKAIVVSNLVVIPTYPVDDFELEFNVVPELCPKCKGLAPFGV